MHKNLILCKRERKLSRFFHYKLTTTCKYEIHVLCLKLYIFPDHSALVMLIHGFAEHLAVYDELGLRLAAQGALVFGHDHGISLFYQP